MDSQTVYSLTGVSRVYGDVAALNNADLTIHKGEWLSIVGPSGSGKTTLMNILGCMDTPTSGTVLLDGERLDRQGERELAIIRRRRIGLIFQKFHLIKHLTALENVMVAQYYHSMPDEGEAHAALERVGMGSRATHLPREMSGGEQQRVCIARALINSPSVVLADEPTGNLDEANEQIVLDLFHRLHDEGTTLVVVTHDAMVASQGQRQVILNHGRIADVVETEDYVRAFGTSTAVSTGSAAAAAADGEGESR
ncbi:ABC transporter ATP-binding protein [Propionicicella superfundia]|uniref:ABC transporter ATP-binding protein n=1 Tax=Propionicicella superfundia TaxID=348582 RepID=UPI00042944C8|nr:ABC transporter ATP-binding protein [Propionicicella superfundia]